VRILSHNAAVCRVSTLSVRVARRTAAVIGGNEKDGERMEQQKAKQKRIKQFYKLANEKQ
jgi:hypothetical protein